MPTCPLCESTQALGDACDVCGRAFSASEALPVRIPRLADLESTLFSSEGEAPADPMPELEPTSARGEPAPVAVAAVEGFTPTAMEPVTVEVEPLEVERVGDDAVLEAEPTPARGVCPSCLTPSSPGQRICASCGVRLPLDRPPPAAAGPAAWPCSDCGVPTTGPQCPACGARR